ncbi:FAD:protein FMN transferase [Patescibacteria group bacterium]|nr:FAD:protein FMN transferase [Patescibacteria group bacterium]
MAILPPIKALGTEFLVEIWDEVPHATLETVHTHLEFLLSEFEHTYSRFKPDSYISILNNQKFIDNPPPDLVRVLQMGISYFDRTDGIHNLMVGETIIAHGYDADYSFTPKGSVFEIPNPHEVLRISDERISLSHGLIDIGGYGKGVAIDLLATRLRSEFGLRYFLINGGGDMYGTSNYGTPITIFLEHPTDPQTYLGTTTIMHEGFAASSIHKRSWTADGIKYHHIIDTKPAGKPSTCSDASFIIASDAVTADVFATVTLLATAEKMSAFALTNSLKVAQFTLPTTFIHNPQFSVQSL